MTVFNRVLVLAPHTDDGEIGCGASIARFSEEGKEVHLAAFSTAKASIPSDLPEDITEKEVREASRILGIQANHVYLFDFPVRRFPEHRQEILQEMIRLREEISPDLVFLPSPTDIHQDHQVVANEGLRAFKSHTILGYEQPWNNITFDTKCFVPVRREDVQKKVDALACYESQSHRGYLNPDYIFGLARTRGTQLGVEFAEAFDVVRWIIPAVRRKK